MPYLREIFGYGLPTLTALPTLFYMRILIILITRRKYRNLECYQIMILIGIVQCLMCPGFFLLGLSTIVNVQAVLIPCMELMVSAARTEILLSFVLALNRLKIMTGLQYPTTIHKILLVLCCAFGLCYLAIFLSPWAGYEVVNYMGHFDLSYPWSYTLLRTGSYEMLTATVATLAVYIILVIAMIRQKARMKLNVAATREKSIVLFAIIKFAGDGSLVAFYHFGPSLVAGISAGCAMGFAYVCNFFLLPPVCYVLFNRSIREEVLGSPKTIHVPTRS